VLYLLMHNSKKTAIL